MWHATLLAWFLAGPPVAEPPFSRPPGPSPRETPPSGLSERARPLTPQENMAFDRLRSQGIAAYGRGDYKAAAHYFREALRIDPGDRLTQAWLRAAEARGG